MSSLQYLKVVVCFITLTDLTKFLLKFCVDEVFEERGVTNVRRIKRAKRSSLGMPKAPQVNISKDTQASKLGDAPVGIPSFFFNKYRYTSVFFCSHDLCPLCFCLFSFKNHASMSQPFIDLYNTSCASLILPPFLYIRCICFFKSQTSASLTKFLEKYINIHNTKFISFDPS